MKYGMCLRCEFCRNLEGDAALDIFDDLNVAYCKGAVCGMEERFNEENFFCCRHAPRDFLRGREKDPETGIQYLFPQLASEDVFNGYVGCGEFEELYYPDEVEGE